MVLVRFTNSTAEETGGSVFALNGVTLTGTVSREPDAKVTGRNIKQPPCTMWSIKFAQANAL
eukprot:scaffold24010_cov30-Prasinocladus_malaysianus.AAC.1